MTDNELIKSLKICVNGSTCKGCKINPKHGNYGYCTSLAINAALDLINRQKAEIEALKLINSTYCAETKTIRDIAFREFAESVKKNRRAILCAIYDRTEYSNIVDNLVKEMTEGEER